MKKFLIIGLLTVVAGIILLLIPNSPPDLECAEEGSLRTSGFVNPEQNNCPITIESYEELRQHETSPQPLRIVGLVLVVIGAATSTVALRKNSRGKS